MKHTLNDKVLTIYLEGRIDSSSADAVEAELTEIRNIPHSSLVLDASSLEYSSSAGLRVILRARKAETDMKITNASSEVYEIFEMTGFTEMMTVEKAYRVFSVDGCEVIGQGANGKVYRVDPETIVKVYFNSDALPAIHRERELARRAFVLGIPTAIPYDVVRVGDTYGSVFELLNAKSFARLIMDNPEDVDRYTDISVELMKKIHSTHIKPNEVPSMKETAIDWANFVSDYLPEAYGKKLVKLFSSVSDKDTLIHGDYHIKNIMMQNGEVLLIDMDTLCYGHPIFELASAFNAYKGFSSVDHNQSRDFLGITYELADRIWNRTLESYCGTTDKFVLESVNNKAALVGFTRIFRRTIKRGIADGENGKKLAEHAKNEIIRLLDLVDDIEI